MIDRTSIDKCKEPMRYYQFKSMTKNFFDVVVKDRSRKNLAFLLTEFFWYSLRDPWLANQYFTKFLYRKQHAPYTNFVVPDQVLYKCWAMNDPDYFSIVADKHLFERFFIHQGIRVASSVAYNNNSVFFTGKDIEQINDAGTFAGYLKRLFKKDSSAIAIIIKKRTGSSGGKSIFRINRGEEDKDREKLIQIFTEVLKSDYMFQFYIRQHQKIEALNPGCLNTMRMDTFTNKDGISRVYSVFLRLGKSGSHVDNVGSGGLYVGVDLKTGRLISPGWSDFSHGAARNSEHSPATGIRFKDYEIPFFNEAVELVHEAASKVPQLRFLGWDVAITGDGPLIIEANETPGITHSEVAQNGFAQNPVFMEALREIFEGREKIRSRNFRLSFTEP